MKRKPFNKTLRVYIILQLLASMTACSTMTIEEYRHKSAVYESLQRTAEHQVRLGQAFHCIGRESMPECI